MDTRDHMLVLKVTTATEQEQTQVDALMRMVQAVSAGNTEVAFADQEYTGEEPATKAAEQRIRLFVVKSDASRRDFRPAAETMGGRTRLRRGRPPPPSGT